jgi:hypothetical protein
MRKHVKLEVHHDHSGGDKIKITSSAITTLSGNIQSWLAAIAKRLAGTISYVGI